MCDDLDEFFPCMYHGVWGLHRWWSQEWTGTRSGLWDSVYSARRCVNFIVESCLTNVLHEKVAIYASANAGMLALGLSSRLYIRPVSVWTVLRRK